MELVIRATVIYWFLWLIVRGSGKRSLAELTPMDLLMVVVLGDFVQQGVTQEDMSIGGAMIAVSVFVAWSFLGDSASRRWRKAQLVLSGAPVIVIRDGEVLMDRLRRERISMDELKEAARIKGHADLGRITLGVLETDGEFSFLE